MTNLLISFIFWWSINSILSNLFLVNSPQGQQHHPIIQFSQGPAVQNHIETVSPKPNFWEIRKQGIFQNRGIAQIEKLGKEYVLTVSCEGVHRVFIHQQKDLQLEEYVGHFIEVRYTYGEVKKQIQCITTPCHAITERRILIQNLKRSVVSEEKRKQFEINCKR